MTQDAVVTKVFPNGMAEVVVARGTACGSNCGNCESCVFQNEIKAFAKNSVHAKPGEKVVIESLSSRIFGAAFIVYIVLRRRCGDRSLSAPQQTKKSHKIRDSQAALR